MNTCLLLKRRSEEVTDSQIKVKHRMLISELFKVTSWQTKLLMETEGIIRRLDDLLDSEGNGDGSRGYLLC